MTCNKCVCGNADDNSVKRQQMTLHQVGYKPDIDPDQVVMDEDTRDNIQSYLDRQGD